ncbi:hypothetical protein FQN60_000728 [Etheostoma spectabile]|uniref:Protein Mis18-alpha n=1 Tax=Etheostoma spectabile TaxID=54343 RepID=A0A5J5CX18_9PERO|nr:hypothetical protein FQN60_000728 [Etheostoma spectabile]
MAARQKSLKHRQENINTTFESSIDSTAVEEKLFGQAEEDEDGDGDDDGPVVFICGKCKLPVGDSMSWDGSEDCQNQIRLKRCNSVLGMVYASTPKNLDHKRFAFCLNVADIESYVLGSASQMLAAEGPKEQPVTLEYRGIVEQQLTEMKMLVMSMAQRLEEIDAGLQEECVVA